MGKKKMLWTWWGILVGLILLLTLFSPSEETLGDLAKIVYLHGAIAAVALLMFAATALLAVVYFITGQKSVGLWSMASAKTAITYWIVYLVSSLYVAYAAWGGILWTEPRLQVAIKVLLASAVALFLYSIIEKERFIIAVNLILGATVWSLRLMAGRIFHPMNPVGSSGSGTMMLFFGSMTACLIAVAVLSAMLWQTDRLKAD